MALVGGRLAALILNRYEWHNLEAPPHYKAKTKLQILFGPAFWDQIRNKTVLDYGCGQGLEAIDMARCGAAYVYALDMREDVLAAARAHQAAANVENCAFVRHCDSKVDVILSVDSFEHFPHPDLVLEEMSRLLKPDGKVIVAFGPPWYHPTGGHFPLFPWAHLLLAEKSLMTWRSKYKTDGAKRFQEVAGGLNQMSIHKFEQIVANSPLKFDTLETVPIRAVRRLHCRLTREFFTSIVRGRLVHRS